jgi:hypothetical protein
MGFEVEGKNRSSKSFFPISKSANPPLSGTEHFYILLTFAGLRILLRFFDRYCLNF